MTLLILLMAGGNVGYSALFPVLGEAQKGLGLDSGLLALFLSVYAVAMLLLGPAGGWLTDRYGAARTLPLAVLTAATGMALVAVADGPMLAIAGRVLWGIGAGLQIAPYSQLAAALAARSGVPAARVFSVTGAALMVALGLGPLLAGLLHPLMSFRGILGVVAVFTALASLVGWYGLRAISTAPDEQEPDDGPRSWLGSVILFGGFDLLIVTVETSLEPLVPLTLGTPAEASFVLTIGTVAYVAGVLGGGRLPPRFLRPRWGVCTMLAGAALMALMPGTPAFVLLNFCLAHGYLMVRDCMSRDPAVSGRAWGTFGLFSGAGVMLGPVLGVAVHSQTPDGAFVLVAVMMAAGAGMFGLGALMRPGRGAHRRAREHAR